MAGKVVVSTLNNDTGVLATQNGMTGIAKAWVNFNGTGTVAIRDSFNVSSITDNGTGDYTVNFTTAMPNANYAVSGCVWATANDGSSSAGEGNRGFAGFNIKGSTGAYATGSVRIYTAVGASTTENGFAFDFSSVNISVFSS